MKAVVVYDSKFGNTERLARAIAETLGAGEPATVVAAGAASERDLVGTDLLAVGGPTQGHGLSPALKAFLERIPPEAVRGVPTVTFDTRLPWPQFLSGSAAAASARRLVKTGARLVVPPESFLVTATEGPLAEGELARACTWATAVRATAGLSEQELAVAAP
jgi:menaquinone-dependent protoporphyrinogen IX oxidase